MIGQGEETGAGTHLPAPADATDRIVAIEALHVSKTLTEGTIPLLRQPVE
jgi:hypothetical protein